MLRRWLWVILALLLLAIAAASWMLRPKPAPRLVVTSARYDQLQGWQEDHTAAALAPLLRSCAAFLPKPDAAPLDPRTKSLDFGPVDDWRQPCAAAATVPAR